MEIIYIKTYKSKNACTRNTNLIFENYFKTSVQGFIIKSSS